LPKVLIEHLVGWGDLNKKLQDCIANMANRKLEKVENEHWMTRKSPAGRGRGQAIENPHKKNGRQVRGVQEKVIGEWGGGGSSAEKENGKVTGEL